MITYTVHTPQRDFMFISGFLEKWGKCHRLICSSETTGYIVAFSNLSEDERQSYIEIDGIKYDYTNMTENYEKISATLYQQKIQNYIDSLP